MCGIAGVLTTRQGREGVSAAEAVGRMVHHQQHRGPDASGLEIVSESPGPAVAFGHTRLAIIDLSPGGHQPMHSADGERVRSPTTARFTTIGRCALSSAPIDPGAPRVTPRCCSKAMQPGGRGVCRTAAGMFAFGLWDAHRQELFPGPRPARHQAAVLLRGRRPVCLRLGGPGTPGHWPGAASTGSIRPGGIPGLSVIAGAADADPWSQGAPARATGSWWTATAR